ncbi:MAG: hemin uptake protein HemP [Elstera sp.]
MSNLAAAPSALGEPAARAVPNDLPVLNSRDLFATQREVLIQHGTDHYRLRLTSTNKLILTK